MKKLIAFTFALWALSCCMYGAEAGQTPAQQQLIERAEPLHPGDPGFKEDQAPEVAATAYKAPRQGLFSRALTAVKTRSHNIWGGLKSAARKVKNYIEMRHEDEDTMTCPNLDKSANARDAQSSFEYFALTAAKARDTQIADTLALGFLAAAIGATATFCKFGISGQAIKSTAGLTSTVSLLSWFCFGKKIDYNLSREMQRSIQLFKKQNISQLEALAGYKAAKETWIPENGYYMSTFSPYLPTCIYHMYYNFFGIRAMHNLYAAYKRSLQTVTC